jgi:hypothetical protein
MKTDLVLFGKRFDVASRARRRRVVITFYAVFAVILVAAWLSGDDPGGGWFTAAFTILVGPLLGGYLSFNLFGSKGLVDSFATKDSDERALKRRDQAHWLAYRHLGNVVIVAFLVEYLRHSSLLRYVQAIGMGPAWLERITYDLLQIGYILFLTLPSAILLWTEPDLEPND